MNDMNICRKIRIGYLLCSVVSLTLGVVIYLIFRKETYLHIVLPETIDLKFEHIREATEENCFISFLKYYFVDFLWGFSLCCSLLAVVDFKKRSRAVVVGCVSAAWGLLFELAQQISLVKGTFDFWDVLMYILAAVIVALINKFLIKRID